uniref:Proline-rich proteoglycan 2-like n=1 Tax=Callorhinus ursinus TaxID=34884 RepID=A0A3Q7QNT1_CALUR|nr:proline-rich proteoglycan 2-like [Callorhinus ursinus]
MGAHCQVQPGVMGAHGQVQPGVMGAYCQARPRGAGDTGSGSHWPGRSLQPQPGARFPGAAAGGAERRGPELPRSQAAGGAQRGHRLLRPQAPPLPPPPPSRPPARPIGSPRPSTTGPLVWPAEAERDLREPWRPPTWGKRDSWDPALPRAAAASLRDGDAGARAAGAEAPFLPEGKERRKPSGCSRSKRAEAPAREARGWRRRRRRRREVRVIPGRRAFHLQAERGCGCQLHKSGGGGGGGRGAPGALWQWREDPDPGTLGARLHLFGPRCRHLE